MYDDTNKDDLIFFDDESEKNNIEDNGKWNILIVDDEEEIHTVTKLALQDVVFKFRPINFLHAYSESEAIDILNENSDISLILLDIVMEKDNSGLNIINYIRKVLKNNFIRIVIRTGQPGQAPEKRVIMDYDINDYKEKAELTSQKLYSTLITSLRSYDNIMLLESNRKALEKIIEISQGFYGYIKFHEFALDIIKYIIDIRSDICLENKINNGFIAMDVNNTGFNIYSATGNYVQYINQTIDKIFNLDFMLLIQSLDSEKRFFYEEKRKIFSFYNSHTEEKFIIYLDFIDDMNQNQLSLLKILFTTISSAFENLCLSHDIINTQTELLITLGQVVETRSKETGNHVRRVAEYSRLLALKYGLNEEDADLLKEASPMHDVGKVGIFDEILNKPSQLTHDEYNIIKNHTNIGYDIFKNSRRKILKAASIIALEHHEKWNGNGYPKGLKGTEIHIFGRITSLADVFDALSCDRIYKKAWEIDKIIDYIKNESGKSFDPALVSIFIDNLAEILEIKEKFKD